MTSKISWLITRHLRKIWVRVVLFALLAVFSVAIAQLAAPLIPSGYAMQIGGESLDQVLNILASSMLAVTTFSLGIAVSAFAAAARSATPRATALLEEDSTAQNVLATFLGAFLFSLVGIIALQAGYYTDKGRLVLFVTTGFVIAAVVIALLRWISHLMNFGRMDDTLDRVEAAATTALADRLDAPYLGGMPIQGPIPESCIPVFAPDTGYVQHIDVGKIADCADAQNVKVWLNVLPGSFVHQACPLFYASRDLVGDEAETMRNAFTIGAERDFDQDPRFGLIVMTEIASRALSPAVNDPGTAISVLGRLVRILSQWTKERELNIQYKSVFVPALDPADIIVDGFRPIARDGAAMIEVQIRLQKALGAVAATGQEELAAAARAMASEALERARLVLSDTDSQMLAEVHGQRFS